MNEGIRQHYLQALGIEGYVPRWVLPGAAESPVLPDEQTEEFAGDERVDSAEPVSNLLPPEAAPAPTPEPRARSPVADTLLNEAGKSRKAREEEHTAPLRPSVAHRFLLSAWRISEHALVLDSRQPKLALPVESLLTNMCFALGCGSSSLPAVEQLRWPLGEPSGLPPEQSVEDARTMVHAYVAAHHERQPVHTLLLMGANAARHGLPAADYRQAVEQAGDWSAKAMASLLHRTVPLRLDAAGPDAGTVQCIVLPSLANLLQKPQLKAHTWRAIKHLRSSF